MLTKEEVTEIVLHCQSEHITYTQRLKELGIPEWMFYASKSRQAKVQKEDDNIGEFVQLPASGTFAPAPALERTRGAKSQEAETVQAENVRLRFEGKSGVTLLMELPSDPRLLSVAIQNFLGHV